ncbi:hypothetical protein ACQP00_16590 [Dactylosporangium sp. CS-047395]|uniref:hypothetical protein n=1 Tax=Dactylosporangium sp. CS-047395 TaxID=3239936 RepID=UPI003D93397D
MRQWIGVTVVAVGIAGAAIIVPPLILPDHEPVAPSLSPSFNPPASAFQPGASPSFAPVAIQAEDPDNKLTGGASAVSCSTCRGGKRVRYMCADCTLVVRFTLPSAGARTVTVYYESDGDRSLKVRVNGGAARTFPASGPDWTVPQSFRFTAELPAGTVELTLYNDSAPAPDLDEIVVG